MFSRRRKLGRMERSGEADAAARRLLRVRSDRGSIYRLRPYVSQHALIDGCARRCAWASSHGR